MIGQARPVVCRDLVELVTDHMDDALEFVDRLAFDEHVSRCRGCAAYLDQMRTTVSLVNATAELQPAPALSGPLEAFRAWSGRVT